MNERIVSPLSVLVAEFGASPFLYLSEPASPALRPYRSLLDYLEAHAVPALGIWILLGILSAVVVPELWRLRQNRSTKLTLLAGLGLVGLVIDLCVSSYLWEHSEAEGFPLEGSPSGAILLRMVVYAALFAITVVTSDLFVRWQVGRNPPEMTPPPRFGRG